jgi:tRNA (cytidine/uridine-2'-O-)-methyltransferase
MQLPDILLLQPEIPPNAGNIIRLCANTGARLHFIHPLGFTLDDRRLRRAGLDYAEFARVVEHTDLDACLAALEPPRLFALTRRGGPPHTDVGYAPGDALLFGPETCGLPDAVLDRIPAERRLRIPRRAGSRSMNLANSVAVVVGAAGRQRGVEGAAPG